MRASSRTIGFLLSAMSLLVGCSAILGIGDLPGPVGAGGGSGDDGGSSSGSSSSGGSSSSSGATSSSSGASGSGSSGSSGGTGKDLSAFLGTWQTVAGTEAFSNCTNTASNGAFEVPTTVSFVITAGTSTDLEGVYSGPDSSGCKITMNVNGTIATGSAGQTCTQVGTTETDIITLETYSFAVTGTTASEHLTGTDMDTAMTGSCDLENTVMYTRM